MPIAIVIAGACIAIAVYFLNVNRPVVASPSNAETVSAKIRGVQSDDHIRGNPNARLVIVEFSDPECPYCKQYQLTLRDIVTFQARTLDELTIAFAESVDDYLEFCAAKGGTSPPS